MQKVYSRRIRQANNSKRLGLLTFTVQQSVEETPNANEGKRSRITEKMLLIHPENWCASHLRQPRAEQCQKCERKQHPSNCYK